MDRTANQASMTHMHGCTPEATMALATATAVVTASSDHPDLKVLGREVSWTCSGDRIAPTCWKKVMMAASREIVSWSLDAFPTNGGKASSGMIIGDAGSQLAVVGWPDAVQISRKKSTASGAARFGSIEGGKGYNMDVQLWSVVSLIYWQPEVAAMFTCQCSQLSFLLQARLLQDDSDYGSVVARVIRAMSLIRGPPLLLFDSATATLHSGQTSLFFQQHPASLQQA